MTMIPMLKKRVLRFRLTRHVLYVLVRVYVSFFWKYNIERKPSTTFFYFGSRSFLCLPWICVLLQKSSPKTFILTSFFKFVERRLLLRGRRGVSESYQLNATKRIKNLSVAKIHYQISHEPVWRRREGERWRGRKGNKKVGRKRRIRKRKEEKYISIFHVRILTVYIVLLNSIRYFRVCLLHFN